MLCPNCDKDYERGQAECPHCGIFFEKWRAKQARSAAPEPARVISPPAIGGGFPFGTLLLAAVVLGGGFWCYKRFTAAPPVKIPDAAAPAKAKAEAEEEAQGPSLGETLAVEEADRKLDIILDELNGQAAVYQVEFSRNDIMAGYNEAAKVPYPGKYSSYAKDLGLTPAPNQPVDAGEQQKERGAKTTFGAKCLINGQWRYLGAPKPQSAEVFQCFERVRSMQQNGFIMIGGSGFVTPWWRPLAWQPHYRRWGRFDEPTLARLIETHIQNKMNFEAEAKDRGESRKILDREGCRSSPDCVKRSLLRAFSTRIARTGLEYQVSLLRSAP